MMHTQIIDDELLKMAEMWGINLLGESGGRLTIDGLYHFHHTCCYVWKAIAMLSIVTIWRW